MSAQGTTEWFAERCGKVTASRIADLMARTKSGYGASRANYMGQLIAERLTGIPQDSYTNAAMQWGIDNEPAARAAYEFHRDCTVVEVGFIPHPKIENTGASPDGLVGKDGLVEIKCPNIATHIETLMSKLKEPPEGTVPDKYVKQIQWQLRCTDRRWCDFVSFDPRMPEELRLFVKRIQRDDKMIVEIEAEVTKFLSELDEKVQQLRRLAA